MINTDAEGTLHNKHGNMGRLIHRLPMVQVEDFHEAMQRHVVGVPHPWVRLFMHLENDVVCYHDHHPGPKE